MIHQIALLSGMFGAPILLVALGHHLRRRTIRAKRLFWGGVIGHTTGIFITLGAMLLSPSASWAGGGDIRVLIVHWSLLGGLVMGLAAAATVRRPWPGGST